MGKFLWVSGLWLCLSSIGLAEGYQSPYRAIQDPNQFGYNHDAVYPGEPGYDALYGPHGTFGATSAANHPVASADCLTSNKVIITNGKKLHAADGKWYLCNRGVFQLTTAPAPVAPAQNAESFQDWRNRMHANAASLDVFGYNRNLSVADEFAARRYRENHPLEFPFRFH